MDAVFRIKFLEGQYYLRTERAAEAIAPFLTAEKETQKPPLQNMKPAIYHGLIDAYTAMDSLKLAKEYIHKPAVRYKRPLESRRNKRRRKLLNNCNFNICS